MWTEASVVASIAACDIGIMPLLNSPWEQGKCGYKLIQYMACNLPVVASKVGANVDIVRNGENGFLAETEQEWVMALDRLLTDSDLCSKMGSAGRQRVEADYCIQKTGPKLAQLLKALLQKS